MKAKFLGEQTLDLKRTKYEKWDSQTWAKFWLAKYGQSDGAHHKAEAIDEVMQILHGTKVKVLLASWDNGKTEERFELDEPSAQYKAFVEDYESDGEFWDKGNL